MWFIGTIKMLTTTIVNDYTSKLTFNKELWTQNQGLFRCRIVALWSKIVEMGDLMFLIPVYDGRAIVLQL